jgi:hypothetical protein
LRRRETTAVSSEPVDALDRVVRDLGARGWEGSASELFWTVLAAVPFGAWKSQTVPRSPASLSATLRARVGLVPGIEITFHGSPRTTGRYITLRRK